VPYKIPEEPFVVCRLFKATWRVLKSIKYACRRLPALNDIEDLILPLRPGRLDTPALRSCQRKLATLQKRSDGLYRRPLGAAFARSSTRARGQRTSRGFACLFGFLAYIEQARPDFQPVRPSPHRHPTHPPPRTNQPRGHRPSHYGGPPTVTQYHQGLAQKVPKLFPAASLAGLVGWYGPTPPPASAPAPCWKVLTSPTPASAKTDENMYSSAVMSSSRPEDKKTTAIRRVIGALVLQARG
jgi:hypothetical protein